VIERSSLDDASLSDNGGGSDGASGGSLGDLSLADVKRGYGKGSPFPPTDQQFPFVHNWMPAIDPWGTPDE